MGRYVRLISQFLMPIDKPRTGLPFGDLNWARSILSPVNRSNIVVFPAFRGPMMSTRKRLHFRRNFMKSRSVMLSVCLSPSSFAMSAFNSRKGSVIEMGSWVAARGSWGLGYHAISARDLGKGQVAACALRAFVEPSRKGGTAAIDIPLIDE